MSRAFVKEQDEVPEGAGGVWNARHHHAQRSLDAGTHRIDLGRAAAAHQGEAEPLVYRNFAFRRITTHEGNQQ